MLLKFYAGGNLKDVGRVQAVGDALVARGLHWLCDWTRMPGLSPADPRVGFASEAANVEGMIERAVEEINACRAADVCVFVAPGGRGTHVEIGATLASRVPVVFWVPPGVDLDQPYPCVFHRHPLVVHVHSADPQEVAWTVHANLDPRVRSNPPGAQP